MVNFLFNLRHTKMPLLHGSGSVQLTKREKNIGLIISLTMMFSVVSGTET